MKITAKEKIQKQLEKKGRGWAFSAQDFLAKMNRSDIDTALFQLEKEGKIRRLIRGIYDYPRYSDLLRKYVAADLDQVAKAIARNFGWRIQPTGNAALNYFRLSTQVPAKTIYLSDGASRDFQIEGRTISFKKASRKDFEPRDSESRLMVQAIRTLGDNILVPETQDRVRRCFDSAQWRRVRQDTVDVPARIHKLICRLGS